MPDVVRRPLQVREQSRRTLDQRIVIRFPRLGTASLRLVTSLPPSSRQQDFLDQAEALEAVGLAAGKRAPRRV